MDDVAVAVLLALFFFFKLQAAGVEIFRNISIFQKPTSHSSWKISTKEID